MKDDEKAVSKPESIGIRPARIADAAQIAGVHVET